MMPSLSCILLAAHPMLLFSLFSDSTKSEISVQPMLSNFPHRRLGPDFLCNRCALGLRYQLSIEKG